MPPAIAATHVARDASRIPSPAPRRAGERDPLDALRADLQQARASAATLGKLYAERARVGARELGFGVALGLWLTLLGIVASIAAAVFLVRGIAGGIAQLAGGAAWAGQLGAAALVLGAIYAVWAISRSRLRSRGLERLRRRYGVARASDQQEATS